MGLSATSASTKKLEPKASAKKSPAAAAPLSGTGLVKFYLERPTNAAARARFSTANIVQMIRNGLPVSEFDEFQQALGVSKERLAAMIGVSRATLLRRRESKLLGAFESERLARFAKLFGRAVEVFESLDSARRWMQMPARGLGDAVPFTFAESDAGAQEVEALLGRIEHSVYT